MSKITVVVPVHNEETTIRKVLKDLIMLKQQNIIQQVIVVNDGSTDGTSRIVETFKKEVQHIKFAKNLGKASAFYVGAKKCKENGSTIMVMVDGDLKGISAEQMTRLINPLIKKGTLMTIGTVKGDSPHLSGQRAIKMSALKPLLYSKNKNWLNLIAGLQKKRTGTRYTYHRAGYGIEYALNYLIGGREFFSKGTPTTAKYVETLFEAGNCSNERVDVSIKRKLAVGIEPGTTDKLILERLAKLKKVRRKRFELKMQKKYPLFPR
ncbi:MAG: glycosyltransferase family 2 protein [archaeon]